MKPDPIQLIDKMAQPIGKLLDTRVAGGSVANICGWSTEANLLTAGTHLDELLDHLDEAH